MNGRSRRDTWIYIFAIIGVLVAMYVVYSLLTAGLQAYIALIAGVMLLVGNLPDLTRALQQRQLGTAMMNTLIGLALIAYFAGALLPWLFYPLTILLLLAAAPLAINRVDVTRAYLSVGRAIASQARHLLRIRQRTL